MKNKQEFKIKNLLTEKHKLDHRFYLVQRAKQFASGLVIGIISGTLFGLYLADPGYIKIGSLNDVGETIEVKAVEVTTEQKLLMWNDAIRQVFSKDEAGKMIRICMKENGSQNPYALNENTNGTYDYSWCQVNSCHKPSNMTDDEWKENLRDPMFNAKQVRKIYLSQGWGAWVVYNKGLVK